MKKLLYILGFLWCLPVSFLGWIFLGILALFDQIEDVEFLPNLSFVWEAKEGSWWDKKGIGWYGWVLGNNIILYQDFDNDRKNRSFIHETEHVVQNYIWGIFFYPVYYLASCYIWLFLKSKHSYLDNPFEIQARIAAGQPKHIPKALWLHGPDDRWAWW